MKAATPADLTGRTIIVTGASPGSIGFETARILREWGATVVTTTRRELELTDAGSVTRFAKSFTALHDRLDALINNAGVHLDLRSQWKEPHLVDGHEIHWRTNYLGTAQLTSLLLSTLIATAQQTGDARVVNVVSKLHSRATNDQLFGEITPYNSWVAYGRSKLALIHHANELNRRYADQGVQGYSLHPGAVYSNIADRGLEESRFLGRLRKFAAPLERRALMSITDGAQTSIHCATSPSATGGLYYRGMTTADPSPEALDATVAARLWDQTETWLATHH